MSVQQYYETAMRRQGYVPDEAQRGVVDRLDHILNALAGPPKKPGLVDRLMNRSTAAVNGLYLWGGVGRGKTFLMDAFYEVLPIEEKQRLHFHRFMILVHEQLHVLGKSANAVRQVARDYASRYRVLCLDEMHITDEGDAAIMEGLIVHMLEKGLTLVTTSNRAPEDLTHDPNIRQLFAHAIDAMQRRLEVINMDGGTDYRLRHMEHADIWHTPLDEQSDTTLQGIFQESITGTVSDAKAISINEREIMTISRSGDVVWFDFAVICGPPRARIDYIEIARMFHTVLIANIPLLDDNNNDYARRFTLLIDELYDHGVKVIVSSDERPQSLYRGSRLAFEFQRTLSRLLEMQSREYLSREHIAE